MTSPEDELPSADDLREAWPMLLQDERAEAFRVLKRLEAEDFFLGLATADQGELICNLPPGEQRLWMRLLAPDDAADVVQHADIRDRERLIGLLDDQARREVVALLAYAEDDAGGLMNPRFARVRPEMTVDEAISYLRRQTRERVELIYYAYVLDQQQRLLGVVSFRELFAAAGTKKLSEVMHTETVSVPENMDQEALSRLFAESDLLALPVLDAQGRMQGIVTGDDIVDVVQEEGTEDIQKFGGVEALDAPYLQIRFLEMVKKRGGWLVVLFAGQFLTASAMGYFQTTLQEAAVLMLFVPLVLSSGGNSGSQASTLVVRAMSLGEVHLRDWWRVFGREVGMGLALGGILGLLGFLRIALWPQRADAYGQYYLELATAIAIALVAAVTWGTITGSMLPFVLRRLGFDPASSSAPLVATLCDVTGLFIYFSCAILLLSGKLLS